MLEIQKWLKENKNDFNKLKDKFGIKSNLYEDRLVLNYSQIDGDKHDTMSKECRALILHYPETDKVMSRSFDRFFNYNEDPRTDEYNILKSKIYEKVDGSLISVYHDSKELCIGTRSMAFAEGETPIGVSYKDLVLRVRPYLFDTINKRMNPKLVSESTFIFELCTPENRVVKQYDGDRLFLLGVRNKITGEFQDDWVVDQIAGKLGFDRPEEIWLNSYEAIAKNISKLPAMDEGYVCNWDNWRIKIKNPAYLAIAHLRENGVISPKRIAKLIFLEDEEEYLGYFPEDKKYFDPYKDAYIDFRENLQYIWTCVKDIKDQKEFALEVKDLEISAFLFAMKKGLTYEEILGRTSDNRKLELLEYYKGKENLR